MSWFPLVITLITLLSVEIGLCELTRERFEEFRHEIYELVTCGTDGDESLAPVCTEGLVASHPDVSLYDMDGSLDETDYNLMGGITRLAFHDCGGIDPEKVESGNTKFFTDSYKNGHAGGCNGCIGIDNPDNDNLLDAAIDPLQPICNSYSDVMSRADCWALAATVTVEVAASILDVSRRPPFFQIINPAISEGDIPYYYGRSDCSNDYESGNVEYPFSNPDGVSFHFPDASLGWTHMAEFFKSRFGWNGKSEYFTNRDIISLISAAHSIGRGHEKISGFSGHWDFSPDTVDNAFISSLFGEDWALNLFDFVQSWNQSVRHPQEANAKPTFQLNVPPATVARFRLNEPPFDPPLLTLDMALNTDMSMVYDLSWYIENNKQFEIDCVSKAQLLCDEDEIILTAPRGITSNFNKNRNGQELGEQYKCGEHQNCCQYKQCPIQCEGGIAEFKRLIDNNLIDTVDDTSDCPAAIAKKYSMRGQRSAEPGNRNLGLDFARAFTKMITIGYVDKKTGQVLLNVVPDAISDGAAAAPSNENKIQVFVGVIALLLFVNILCLCYKNCASFKKTHQYVKVVQVASSDDDMQNAKEYQI